MAGSDEAASRAKELRMTDVAIAGGGIAGSTLAILLGRGGLKVELFERDAFPREKPCGEGLMPAGVAVLERLGLADTIGGVPLRGVRYHFRGAIATGAFPPRSEAFGIGRAQRRAVLDRVLFEAAAATPGVRARTGARVQAPIVEHGRVAGLIVDGAPRHARLTVAADGVHSRLRRAAGLDRVPRHPRIGMRAHFRLAPRVEIEPWVDVLVGADHELYVTALPHGELLVAALADRAALGAPAESTFNVWCRAQPFLAERLKGATRLTPLLGRSPLVARARRGYVPGMVLLGDAAGSTDPITGGGMSHALESAELLAAYAPHALDQRAPVLAEFDRQRRALHADCAMLTGGLLWLSRHPRFIGLALAGLRTRPALLSHLVGVAAGTRSFWGARQEPRFLAFEPSSPRIV
jgi:flavin-dependent dehydrogenase